MFSIYRKDTYYLFNNSFKHLLSATQNQTILFSKLVAISKNMSEVICNYERGRTNSRTVSHKTSLDINC